MGGSLAGCSSRCWSAKVSRSAASVEVGIGITRGLDLDLLRGIQAPELAAVGQGAEDDLEIARVAVPGLDGDLGDARPGATAPGVALPLPAPGGLGLAVFPGLEGFGLQVIEDAGLGGLLARDGGGEVAQRALVDAREDLGDGGLGDPKRGGDLALPVALMRKFEDLGFPEPNAPAGSAPPLPPRRGVRALIGSSARAAAAGPARRCRFPSA